MGVIVKKIILATSILFVIFVATTIYSMATLSIQQLVICSSDDEAFYIPKSICKYYMYNYRGNYEDIKSLESHSNISYLFETQDTNERYRQIDFFLESGADINHISNIDGLTPLHAAVLMNDPELVKYLLSKGADPLKEDTNKGVSVYKFVDLLIKNKTNNSVNLNNIRNILLEFRKTKT